MKPCKAKTGGYMSKHAFDTTAGQTLADSAYARLRRDIIVGVRVPGERLRFEWFITIF